MATENEVSGILAKLAALYPRYELKPETVPAYASMLSDVPLDELRAAAAVCASSKEFFPSLHELRAAVATLRIRAQRIPEAIEAFMEATLAHAGHNWSHEIVKQVAYTMGWKSGIFPTENVVSDRSQFIKAYEAAVNDLVWSQTVHPGVLAHIEQSRPPALPAPEAPALPVQDAPHHYPTMREALGAETVAAVAARLRESAGSKSL